MQLAAVSLDEGEDPSMNLEATQAAPDAQPRAAPMKFTYASGARPLDGYTIKRGIGHGGFGEVYYATSDAGKEVALKLIRRNLDIELRGVTQCLNLKHPNLLDLYDVRQDGLGDSWVIMEYVAGESLEDALSRHPDGLPHDEALAWFHGIAAGVAYLHDHGIVHRDLKPGNIFRDEGLVKIGDYGLSKFISASRRSGQTESVGTVHYMAPEIGNGRYGKEIDIYALGIILYEMLTGHVPFEGESVGEVLMKHLTAEPNLERVEEPYRSAIAKTLTKNPELRLKNVGDLLALLPAGSASVGWALPSGGATASRPPLGERTPFRRANGDAREVVEARLADEEPILKAVRTGWRRFADVWNSGRINGIAKVVLIVAAIYVFSHTLWLIPFAAVAAVAYAVYYVVRLIVLDGGPIRKPPTTPRPQSPLRTAQAPPVSPQSDVVPVSDAQEAIRERGVARAARRGALAATMVFLPPKPLRQRVEELFGSMLLSAAVVTAIGLALSIVAGQMPKLEQFVWLAAVSTLGAWLVLVPAKLWEGRPGEPVLRRFALLVLGMGLGGAAWIIKDLLFVPLPYDWHMPPPITRHYLNADFYDGDGVPRLIGHMAYFGFLLLVMRWWKQADPLRPARMSIWTTLVAAFWGWLLALIWPFPQPWGIIVAVTMSIAVQLTSPWYAGKAIAS